MKLSFSRMADELAMKGKRVLISLLHSLYNLGQMPKSVFVFTPFDRKIAPVLLYDLKFGAFLSVNLRNLYIDMLANGICASVYMHQICSPW